MLRTHLADFDGVTLLVTHDPAEVMTLASRVLVLDHGSITQDADSHQLIRRPGTPWLATMLNLNTWAGTVRSGDTVDLDAGGVLHATDLPDIGSRVLLTAPPTLDHAVCRPPARQPSQRLGVPWSRTPSNWVTASGSP